MATRNRKSQAEVPEEVPVEAEAEASAPEAAGPSVGKTGLVARGLVLRRTRKVVGEGHEVITYTLGPRIVTVELWDPTDIPVAVGALAEFEVYTTIFNGRVGLNVAKREEEF